MPFKELVVPRWLAALVLFIAACGPAALVYVIASSEAQSDLEREVDRLLCESEVTSRAEVRGALIKARFRAQAAGQPTVAVTEFLHELPMKVCVQRGEHWHAVERNGP